ncbi:MAG TPA: TonB family protein [Caulobacteraceae bacterium]
MRLRMIGLGVVLCFVTPLSAWPEPSGGPDIMRYYPDHARRLGIEGRAVIRCSITAESTLKDCSVVSEEPPGEGFGVAALRMSVLFRMEPKGSKAGPPDGGTVEVPIRFQLPKSDPPAYPAQGQTAISAPVPPPR